MSSKSAGKQHEKPKSILDALRLHLSKQRKVLIYSNSAVQTVCVVPVEDDAAGEVPLACVILKEDGHGTGNRQVW